MTQVETKFLEIEHKFLIPLNQDLSSFFERLAKLDIMRQSEVEVEDTYFLLEKVPGYIYRHRFDQELQQLTVKSLTENPEVRLEVNLDLGHHKGSQKDFVESFLDPLGILWSGTLLKKVNAFYLMDCEIVHYKACFADKEVRCVEIEATHASTVKEARMVINHYESLLGLDPSQRCLDSLFHLLLAPHIPKELLPGSHNFVYGN